MRAKWVNSISDLFGLSEGHSVGCQKVVGNMALSLKSRKSRNVEAMSSTKPSCINCAISPVVQTLPAPPLR